MGVSLPVSLTKGPINLSLLADGPKTFLRQLLEAMDQISAYAQQNSGLINTIVFVLIASLVLYVVYTYLYPSDDPSYIQFLRQEVDARKPPIVLLKGGKVPPIFTGGDFTLSFWIYVDDFNFRVSKYKPLFNLGPSVIGDTSRSVLVGMLTPFKNGLMVRGATTSTSNGTPDITIPSVRKSLLEQQTSMAMFETTVETPCDIKEVPLQRWVNVTIVSSGRILDVYMNGKLGRSCVLDSILQVPKGDNFLSLGVFGGRFSSAQMWNQQITPDVIYGIYMMGPTQTQHSIVTDISKYLGLNVSFTGPVPGQTSVATDPFAAISTDMAAAGCNTNTLLAAVPGYDALSKSMTG